MACDSLCGFKKNGWHDIACPESSDSLSSNKVFDKSTTPPVELDGSSVMCRDRIWVLLRTKEDRNSHKWACIQDYPFLADAPIEGCKNLESTIKTMREALEAIDAHPANGNSEPEAMVMALNKIRLIARTALQEGN